ncbi:MAG: CRISPR-associated endoribonuclease Cas6 [Dethiobacteria bacterium]
MQLTLFFHSNGPVYIPVQYNHLVQGLIYHSMENPLLRKYLHEHGFMFEKRSFKLFTFSRLMGKETYFNKEKGWLKLIPPLSLIICSPVPFILQELGTGLLRRGQARIGPTQLEIDRIDVAEIHISKDKVQVHMLSPLTVYSTLPSSEGRRYTYYYSPFEPRFGELTRENLIKKYKLIHGSPPPNDEFAIEPLAVEEKDHKVTRYKNFIIKGWMGDYELRGDPALLQVALSAGLGAKNSQGYGCCRLVQDDL